MLMEGLQLKRRHARKVSRREGHRHFSRCHVAVLFYSSDSEDSRCKNFCQERWHFVGTAQLFVFNSVICVGHAQFEKIVRHPSLGMGSRYMNYVQVTSFAKTGVKISYLWPLPMPHCSHASEPQQNVQDFACQFRICQSLNQL